MPNSLHRDIDAHPHFCWSWLSVAARRVRRREVIRRGPSRGEVIINKGNTAFGQSIDEW